MTEIAPCPYCGSDCIQQAFGTQVRCADEECAYRIPGAFAAHNALAADVELARNLRKVLPDNTADVKIGMCTDGEVVATLCTHGAIYEVADTLDAALAELAEKIGGNDDIKP